MDHSTIETTLKQSIDFSKIDRILDQGVIPVAVQEIRTKQVLILAYANRESIEYTLKHRIAAFWSTSRNKLWIKGEVSGAFLKVREVLINCEQNSLLYLVGLRGQGACHTKDSQGKFRISCFYRRLKDLDNLESIDHFGSGNV